VPSTQHGRRPLVRIACTCGALVAVNFESPFASGRHAEKAFRTPHEASLAYLMIHQLEIGRDDHGDRRVTCRPEWHNPAMFIGRID